MSRKKRQKNDENRFSNNYIVVFGWMINKLKLNGNRLLVFGTIYGFSQDGENVYSGSLEYLSRLLNISSRTVLRTLSELTEEGYILKEKEDNFCKYKANIDLINTLVFGINNQCQSVIEGEKSGDKVSHTLRQNVTPNGDKMSHNNKYNNKYIYMTHGEFKNVQLTEEQYNKLKERDMLPYIKQLSVYMESTGKKYKSHYATILNWYRKDHPEEQKEETESEEYKAPSIEELGDYLI